MGEGACGGVVCVWPFEVNAWGFAKPEVALIIVDAYYVVLLLLGEVCCGSWAPCLEVFWGERFSAVCDAAWASVIILFSEEEDSGAFVWGHLFGLCDAGS